MIRKATINDLENIQKLNLKLFENELKNYDKTLDINYPFSEKGENYFKERIEKENGLALVAEMDEKIVGYIVAGENIIAEYRKQVKIGELENIFILKEYRNKEIGTQLIQEALKWCKEKQFQKVRAVASFGNKKAIELYKKIGFKEYELILEKGEIK